MASEWVALDHIRNVQGFMARLGWISYKGRCLGGFDEGGDQKALAFVNAHLDRVGYW